MLTGAKCGFCGQREKLLLCSRCKSVYYCNRDHQVKDWKNHKKSCISNSPVSRRNSKSINSSNTLGVYQDSNRPKAVPFNRLNASTVDNICDGICNSSLLDNVDEPKCPSDSPIRIEKDVKMNTAECDLTYENSQNYDQISDVCINNLFNRTEMDIREDICRNVIADMNQFGICVVDNFLGRVKGMGVLEEVRMLHERGQFEAGKLVTNTGGRELTTIRSDEIVWIDGRDPSTKHIEMLITEVDNIVMKSNRMEKNGLMGNFEINNRTQAMVACYPGDGTHYVKHVDNPNEDGRRITAIYYLNLDWDVGKDGGLLRIFPHGWHEVAADIEPVFDRLLFFWSDRRNPHEVQPSFRTRYAITLWYFDADERKRYLARKTRQ